MALRRRPRTRARISGSRAQPMLAVANKSSGTFDFPEAQSTSSFLKSFEASKPDRHRADNSSKEAWPLRARAARATGSIESPASPRIDRSVNTPSIWRSSGSVVHQRYGVNADSHCIGRNVGDLDFKSGFRASDEASIGSLDNGFSNDNRKFGLIRCSICTEAKAMSRSISRIITS